MSRSINAALVHTLGEAPRYAQTLLKGPLEDQVQVKVLATGLHQLVRSRASGKHYSSGGTLPLIPGVDGVGTLPSGEKVYFAAFGPGSGSFAEYVNVNKKEYIPIPQDADPATIAALVNPAMSSWLALNCRAQLKPGFSVLILGVTGASGKLAIQVARCLGASRIVGLGRNQETLEALRSSGLDATVALTDDINATKASIAKEAANVDIVLDYLWGPPAQYTMEAILAHRTEADQRLDWVQIGNMAGPSMQLPAKLLRSSNFVVSGSGIGSVSLPDMLKEISKLVVELSTGRLTHPVSRHQLSDIEKVWNAKEADRVVFLP
ncbi:zinc-binding dehydrogenase family protein [Basidiobolus meristosporus CBS 931.73]|uniref:Zinc-binding dehydrogenase family protein n=1 Tax=Basidiobolus meristosporus CBS 931.73 TaxID=1314790 RepID=A0A1Y1YLU0_9FUNG|nr:zinc-binding dehydrogenase family protein [Basidiobolus meristosporus CBS 931.73]|eukprot:ORX98980.1 zinc-binding dehydrogenase family protein [Basidiobolus meristosporus CBS 931.73]